MKKKVFYCPVDAMDFPYYTMGCCTMVDDGYNPYLECDDAYATTDGEHVDYHRALVEVERGV